MTMTLIGQGVWLFSRETQIQEVGRHPTKGLSPERDLTWGQLHYRPLYRALTFWFPGTTKAYIQLEGIHSVGSQETTLAEIQVGGIIFPDQIYELRR